jgi:ketosteroid isomerase-like protein
MIGFLMRRVVERGYRQVNAFDLDRLTSAFAPDAVFEFQGNTPFGGERHGPAGVRAWFEQIAREFGRLHLTADEVAVSGPPWNMLVIVRFTDRYQLITGDVLDNYGFQYLRLRWGKVTEDRILADLGIVRSALELIDNATPTP